MFDWRNIEFNTTKQELLDIHTLGDYSDLMWYGDNNKGIKGYVNMNHFKETPLCDLLRYMFGDNPVIPLPNYVSYHSLYNNLLFYQIVKGVKKGIFILTINLKENTFLGYQGLLMTRTNKWCMYVKGKPYNYVVRNAYAIVSRFLYMMYEKRNEFFPLPFDTSFANFNLSFVDANSMIYESDGIYIYDHDEFLVGKSDFEGFVIDVDIIE